MGRLVCGVALLATLLAGASLAQGTRAEAQAPAPGTPSPIGAANAQDAAVALDTSITYQGELRDTSGPVAGPCDFEFSLYDALSGGRQVGSVQGREKVTLSDGRFTVALDFGAAYDEARWLQISARCPAGSGAWQTLSPRQRLTTAAAALSVPWSGLTGVPAGFADGADADTTYTAGLGLTLSGTQLSANLDEVQARVSSTCAGGSAIRAVNADGTVVCQAAGIYAAGSGLSESDGQVSLDTSQFQARVRGNCAAGGTVRLVAADGAVYCAPDAVNGRAGAPAANTATTLDSAGATLSQSSVTIGADGLGLIAYWEGTSGALRVAHCSNVACSAATLSTLGTYGSAGSVNSIAIGADGLGLIAYYDPTNAHLKVAHCADLACANAALVTVDSSSSVGTYASLAIGADGLGLISYYDESSRNLKAAHCSDVACSAATVSTLDSPGSVGSMTSLAIGADGLGLISYYDATNLDLKAAHCSNLACTSATLSTLDSADRVGKYSSVTIGADGLGLIAYYDESYRNLKVAHCGNVACSSAALATLDSPGIVGFYTSITVGTDGLGLIAYHDSTNLDLKVAHCHDAACSSASLATVESSGSVGQYTAVTIGADGLPLITYCEDDNDTLKVMHLGSASGVPYLRRR